ncbi:4Fe-4S single cluster domain-containing protein [Legionella micdadei]|uniref:4Fe-4S single cluster domain-containing protein n=1 Tax=Legionella micdadei TaxID=451 RepID=UPI0009EF7655|nr:4Fe-4S single cluster domain-containing protein [Legionella micdadei]ARH00453.1 radical SAM protein [Legionella micdadei]
MNLYLSRIHYPVTTLGPGKRIGIWFQGCSIRCSGCVSTDTWVTQKNEIKVESLVESILPWLSNAEGITISGGEPFDQPEALMCLLQSLRAKTTVDILVYSGYSFENISHIISKLHGLIDVLISEPYDVNSPQTLSLRGSDNQRLHYLTSLGKERFQVYEQITLEDSKSFDLMFDTDGTIWFAGIPKRHDMFRLKEILERDGHSIVSTQDKRVLEGVKS